MMDFNQKFEPKGNKVIHGAGQQFPKDFRDYWNAVGEYKPLLYMTYIEIKWPDENWFKIIKKEIKEFPNVMLQIGLSMTNEVEEGPQSHYEHDVATGKYDSKIDDFCKGIKGLGIPTFVRLGYEFNGLSWNGYLPKTYIKAWKHFVDRIRKNNINNIAIVWCYCPEGEKNYQDYYPGDNYVDWWAIDIFSSDYFKDPFTEKFMQDAEKHKKPVMIGESSARYVGTLDGQKSWDNWFKPYFEWIENHPIVKAFCYINWNWSKHKHWKNWGDCRISRNEIVKKKYLEEISKPKYIHNQPVAKFLKKIYH